MIAEKLLHSSKKRFRGQGTIEYAGALIIAMILIVVAVMGIGQPQMGNVYNTVFDSVENMFADEANNI